MANDVSLFRLFPACDRVFDREMFASASVDASTARQRFIQRLVGAQRGSMDDLFQNAIASSDTLEESAGCLLNLLAGGFSVWSDGTLLETRALVQQLGGLKIVIHTREHGPPHFHVMAAGVDATFAIHDCAQLHGTIGGKELGLVRYWHAQARPLLVKKWNETRPSDCPVGPIKT